MAKLMAKDRTKSGSRAARVLRKEGLIPGIIYGHGQESEKITLSEHEMEVLLLHGAKVIEVDLGGKIQNVLVKDVQWDVYGKVVIHVDLTRVNLDELVTMTIQVNLRGTPEGAKDGGVLRQLVNEVNVECKVRAIPDDLRVSISEMNVNDRILLGDIEMPEGVVLKDDPEDILCILEIMAEEAEAAEGEEGEEPAGPEVIGVKKDDDEESE
ncbi:MAG TPA: 50S ribosomal protein L25 [Phycisphaerae bacterium]|nr:50S ribosomal protein L25 [Phycisphaerae bacterium]